MDAGLVSSLSGALAQNKRVEVIANNLANADTPAFKSDDLSFEESVQGAQRQDLRSEIPERPYTESELLSQAGRERRAVLYATEYTNLKAGGIKQTGNPLDVAIEGNGFLEVLTPNGVRLTRAGNMALDPGGRLMTQDGFLVLGPGAAGQDPALRAITVGPGRLVIDQEGNLFANNERGNTPLGRLSVVQVANPKELKKDGRNTFEASPDAAVRPVGGAAPATPVRDIAQVANDVNNPSAVPKENPLGPLALAPKIHQGMLEASNVEPVREMTKLIEAHRLFDQNTRLMQSIGDINAKSADIGRF